MLKMAPHLTLETAATGRTVSLMITLLFCMTPVLAEQSHDIYGELPLTRPRELQISADHVKPPRLLDLLQLKQSMSNLLPSNSGSASKYGGAMDEPDLSKRVFCNGFTGCGGRFRGRRRQQQPVAEIGKRLLPVFTKRPFCNTYGCYNSGQKRSMELASDIRDDASQMAQQKMVAFADGWSGNKIKKLFCNGYGGCQNLGKRLAFLDAAMPKSISGEDERLLPMSKGTSDKSASQKRFFSSNFDDDVDSLIDSMKR